MPARRIAAFVSPVLRVVEWLFSELAPGVDLALGLLGFGWLSLMITRPDLFDVGNFRGMEWMPGGDVSWIAFMALTTALHFAGLARLHWSKLRYKAHLLSSWYWLLISFSFFRVDWSTGVIAYGLVGLGALCSAIYVSGHPRTGP